VKINGLFIKLFVILTLLHTITIANSNIAGLLKSGDDIVLEPYNGHALSITRRVGRNLSNSSYDFIMLNSGEVIYEDRNQVDDVYLIFHDDVQEGDRIKIHVNRGFFDYEIKPLQALPKIVKEVIEPEVLERAKQLPKAKKEPKKREAKREKKEKYQQEVTKPKKPLVALSPQQAPKTPLAPKEKEVSKHVENSSTPVSESFFARFTQIFKDLVKSFSLRPVTTTKEHKEIVDNKKVAKEIRQEVDREKLQKHRDEEPLKSGLKEHFDDRALQQAAATKEQLPFNTTAQKGLVIEGDDLLLKEAHLEESAFVKPKRGIGEDFDDQALQAEAKIETKAFHTPNPIAVNSTLVAKIEEKFQGLKQQTPQFKQEKISKNIEAVPTFRESVPTLPHRAPLEEIKDMQKESIPTFTQKKPSPIVAVEERPEVVAQERVTPLVIKEKLPTPTQVPAYEDKTAAYPDTGYKEGYETLNQQPKPLEHIAQAKPSTPVVIDETLPQNQEPRVDEEKRLVITKRIDKKEPQADPFAGRVLGRMDDRVLGTGYNGANSSAKLGVRVTKNRRPISAWIEVFKNGTKQRVKTFYTSKSAKTKNVKLPAGTYMVRATYRTRGSKQQKTIKNIHLAEADSVTKNIAFYDGTLRVIARRGADPLYVKVIAYKSGTHRRVSYDFSSRSSGIAKLTLSSGTYDIEVLEHDKSRFFENIRIRGGQTKTINVDF
jgi:hypothetical protein